MKQDAAAKRSISNRSRAFFHLYHSSYSASDHKPISDSRVYSGTGYCITPNRIPRIGVPVPLPLCARFCVQGGHPARACPLFLSLSPRGKGQTMRTYQSIPRAPPDVSTFYYYDGQYPRQKNYIYHSGGNYP